MGAPISVGHVAVTFGGERHRLRAVAVQPLTFRSVAPAPTRSADFVWTSLLGGRAVLTPDAARDLGFDLSLTLMVKRHEVGVGALADNAVPNFGDIMIPDTIARDIGLKPADELIVGVKPGTDLDVVEKALKDRLGRRVARVERLQAEPNDPTPAAPTGVAEGELIGTMNFRILKGGFIDPDPDWVATNIATGSVPILGSVTCHRVMFPQLGAALAEIENRKLAREIDVKEFGGCYVPRFIDRDRRGALSMHAFGLAIDLNVSENYMGTRGNMDPKVVEIFEKWGFEWGGRWSRPDPMHFELDRLINV